MIAGSDTTATAVRATLLHIISSPRVYATLQAEIDSAITSSHIIPPSPAIITYAQALQLPYLQAVIYEGLRIWPPFNGFPFKVVPANGDFFECGDDSDGRKKRLFVPAGTRVAPNTPVLNRRRDIFGEDADEFRPERWLHVSESKAAEMKRAVELVFGYGRWMCAGKHVAFLELNKVFVEVSIPFLNYHTFPSVVSGFLSFFFVLCRM